MTKAGARVTLQLVGCHLLMEDKYEHLNSFLPQSQVTHRDTVPSNKPTSFPPGLPPPKHTDTPVCRQTSQVSKLYLGWGGGLASKANAVKSSAAAKLVGVKSHGSQDL